ncbi:polyprenol reductase-like isoform X2 [Nylanderia fulva]|uniref:polyprenol reductase-like isoform X2 n=1 Tax=Nylanderia fulva TaxID=613905 RepID=UPI0010FB305A|nr:polyprenol reductase-like isoform X2 [Nylanderia fulva]
MQQNHWIIIHTYTHLHINVFSLINRIMDINIVYYVLIFESVCIGLTGLLINCMESYLPIIISSAYRYGKFSSKVHCIKLRKIEMPKRYFGHYYIICGPMLIFLFCLALNKYFYNENAPEIVLSLLDTLLGTSRKALVSVETAILAIGVFSIHIWKRIYEMYYVCIFSDQKINILHYIITFLHYTTVLLCLIGESEGFVKGSHVDLSSPKLTTVQLMCAIIFLWSTYVQLECNFILAKLRKNQHGDVVTKEHKVPFGGLFKYISNPLQLTEIIIYIMLSGILWQTCVFHYATLFVIINQTECAILSDQWYRNTFKNFPKERKILIPYIW